ncbi:MAG: hypothetical protein PHI88_00140 [Candidatus Pacebacteria bacterium]|nr:hypothetical protein [Candidatus Paceibacterota bacterium]
MIGAKATTQDFVTIKKIKEDVVILKQGGWRNILMASSINFDLMSDEEKEAVIYQFQSFLNSLDFEIQILIQSRKLNLKPYLKQLEEVEAKQENELLKIQANEYREFIRSLSSMANLISKNFYIVVPFYPPVKEMSDKEFKRWKSQINLRSQYVINGLRGTGVSALLLGSDEIVELLWGFYNPDKTDKETMPIFPKID